MRTAENKAVDAKINATLRGIRFLLGWSLIMFAGCDLVRYLAFNSLIRFLSNRIQVFLLPSPSHKLGIAQLVERETVVPCADISRSLVQFRFSRIFFEKF